MIVFFLKLKIISNRIVLKLKKIKAVVQLHKNALGDRKVVDVKCFRTPHIKVTENHEFFSISQEQLIIFCGILTLVLISSIVRMRLIGDRTRQIATYLDTEAG